MRKVTGYLLWLFVFSVPWGIAGFLPEIGTVSRTLGIVATGAAALTALAEGRVRPPGAIFWASLTFAVSAVLSLAWTIAYPDTYERAGTYVQYAALVWVLREYGRTRDEQNALLLAFCLGCLVYIAGLLQNFAHGIQARMPETRYTASGINPNYVAFTMVMGFPMAWHLFRTHRRVVRVIAILFCSLAPITIILTASRAAFLAGIPAISQVPLTLFRESRRTFVVVMLLGCLAAVWTARLVPQSSWDRLLTITGELEGGTMSGRTVIWNAGWRVFQDHMLFGVGAGAFPKAVAPLIDRARPAHNIVLSLLVEQGIVGFSIFAFLLGACARLVLKLQSAERTMWAALMIAWLISAMAADSHFDKVTWLVIGMLAAHAPDSSRRLQPSEEGLEADFIVADRRLHAAGA